MGASSKEQQKPEAHDTVNQQIVRYTGTSINTNGVTVELRCCAAPGYLIWGHGVECTKRLQIHCCNEN